VSYDEPRLDHGGDDSFDFRLSANVDENHVQNQGQQDQNNNQDKDQKDDTYDIIDQ